MDVLLTNILRCPLHVDAGPLTPVNRAGPGEGENSGVKLRCPRCGTEYPVTQGIPSLLGPDRYPAGFREREMRQWDDQAARYDEGRLRDAVYMAGVQAAVTALGPRPGELILDAACGTGATVRIYQGAALRVVASDLSWRSLRHLRAALAPAAVHLVQADATALPFADAVFDRVLCANVLQHLPDEHSRQDLIGELARVARPGARVVVTAHNYSIPKRRAGWPKEGTAGGHSGSLQYIYRFDVQEFHALLATALRVEAVRGAGLPLPYRLKLSGLSALLERFLRRFGASAHWGNMLVGVCRKVPDPPGEAEAAIRSS